MWVKGNHYLLIILDTVTKEVIYFDWYGKENEHALRYVLRWYSDEVLDKTGDTIETAGWKKVSKSSYCPTQEDGTSCGLFLIYMAEYIELMKIPDFGQSEMDVLRVRTALYLGLHKKKLPEA